MSLCVNCCLLRDVCCLSVLSVCAIVNCSLLVVCCWFVVDCCPLFVVGRFRCSLFVAFVGCCLRFAFSLFVVCSMVC